MNTPSTNLLISHEPLRRLCTAIQTKFNIPEADAAVVSDCLVEANLMGLDTHGVIRLKFYLDRVKAGGNNPRPNIRALREHPCTALLDADNALGPVGAKRGMDLAIAKARDHGVGVVIVRNCNHSGPAGHYARMALAHDMIGLSVTNVLASMPPTGGAEARVGNNAYAIAFPSEAEPSVVVDGATSMASWGKVMLCAQTGTDLPGGCYVDREGQPTVKPKDVMDGGALLPFAAHKGYGMAVAIEMLTGMLGDAALDQDIPHPYKKLAQPGANTFYQAAIRIDHFSDPGAFKRRTDEWIRFIRNTRRAPGVERIWLPGEKEAETYRQRHSRGIPLNVKMVQELRDLAAEAKVPFELGTGA